MVSRSRVYFNIVESKIEKNVFPFIIALLNYIEIFQHVGISMYRLKQKLVSNLIL